MAGFCSDSNYIRSYILDAIWSLVAIYAVYCDVLCMYREEYYSMKKQWKSFSVVQLQIFRLFREHRDLISEQLIELKLILMNISILHSF